MPYLGFKNIKQFTKFRVLEPYAVNTASTVLRGVYFLQETQVSRTKPIFCFPYDCFQKVGRVRFLPFLSFLLLRFSGKNGTFYFFLRRGLPSSSRRLPTKYRAFPEAGRRRRKRLALPYEVPEGKKYVSFYVLRRDKKHGTFGTFGNQSSASSSLQKRKEERVSCFFFRKRRRQFRKGVNKNKAFKL